MKLRTVIIEDHKDSRELLELLCDPIPEIEVVGIASSVNDGLELIKTKMPSLVFLDVGLQQGNGFDLLEKIDRRENPFHLVFTTGDPNHAINAIKHDADDYLLKPLKSAELLKTIGTLIGKHYLLTKGKRHLLLESIIYIRSRGNNVEYYTTDREQPLIERASLASVLCQLPTQNFHQIHRSFLINKDHIKEVNQSSVLLSKMHRIPVGDTYQSVLSQIS